jgi:Fe(3+) dicitrate transport protein
MRFSVLTFILAFSLNCFAGDAEKLFGYVVGNNATPLSDAQVLLDEDTWVLTDAKGYFNFNFITPGKHSIQVYYLGYDLLDTIISVPFTAPLSFQLIPLLQELQEIKLEAKREGTNGYTRLRAIEGTQIYAGKKNEVILVSETQGNLATNNSREIYAKVAGLNIWESDGAGLQLGIGARGLSPDRTSNFNVRQNGYDIAADALGYPESYYNPPAEAIDRIEVTRGASSLQYGTQFGGMLNFVLKEGNPDSTVEVKSNHTFGSFGLYSTFNSVGGTKGKWNYYSFLQYKRGDGWRENSGFEATTGYISLKYQFNPRLSTKVEYTHMNYVAQQPGGLTDVMFAQNAQQSIRERNFFKVKWNLFALITDFKLNENSIFNLRLFALDASRESLGFLGRIDRADPNEERDLIRGQFANKGAELRFLQRYKFLNRAMVFTSGYRIYQGKTIGQQGLADDSYKSNFEFLNPENLERSDYTFPSINHALFVENLISFSRGWSITPGFRLEHIKTQATGWYREVNTDLVGDTIYESVNYEDRSSLRNIGLGAIGVSYKPGSNREWYGNISQNYRAINFNDLRIVNPSFKIDSNLQDEKGITLDLGQRGRLGNYLTYDVSVFYLAYQNRIGLIQMTDLSTFTTYRYRTNIADSKSYGLELFAELDVLSLFHPKKDIHKLSVFATGSVLHAIYTNSNEMAIENKNVELVPPFTLRSGISYSFKECTFKMQYSYTAAQFTDATNAVEGNSSAIIGEIPAYGVMDLSFSAPYKSVDFTAGINNALNSIYFTRRATAYPGPGIIPSDGRSFYLGMNLNF